MYVAAYVQLLPPVVGALAHRLTSPARRWVVVWCLMLALQDAVSRLVTLLRGENLFVAYIFLPITGAIALWVLSLWQSGPTSRLAMRLAIPGFVAVSVGLSLLADDPHSFSLVTAPFYAVVMLIASSWTFVRRSLGGDGTLLEQDWFWMVGGIMLYFGAFTAMQPLVSYFLASGRNDLILAAFNVRSAMTLLAFVAITGGMLCPVRPTYSGGLFSPPSSPSPSWSPPWARRW